ncbi:MAG: tape measure protein [Desulfocapsa sp.]|nr:tape measure protein [Desulfocapsa sp.]
MTDFRINVIVDPSKALRPMDKVDNRLKKTEASAKRLQGTMSRAFTLIGIVAAVRGLGQMVDAVTNARNRIRLVTKDAAQLNGVMEELFNISKRTRTGFEATATIFSRTALSVKDLGLSQRETLEFTESLNQAIVLSGVKAQEANAGLIQLSQGLASGTLRGDELRSVLEQLPKVADVIAEGMKVTRGELRLLGQEGKISAKDVIDAFKGAASELRRDFGESIPTISQAFSVLRSSAIQFISVFDNATGASEKLARSILALAENLDTIAKFAVVAGAALAGPFAKAGVLFATRAVVALSVAILANPIGALIIGLTAGVTALLQFGDEITVTADGMVTLKDVAIATFDLILDSIQPVVDFMTEGFEIAINFIINAFSKLGLTFNGVLDLVVKFVNAFIGHFVGLGNAARSIFKDLRELIISFLGDDLLATMGFLVQSFIKFITSGLGVVFDFMKGILQGLGIIATELNKTIDGLELPDVDSSFTGNMVRIGQNAKKAYLEGFGKDYVGDLVALVIPAFEKVEENARKIAAARRKVARTADAALDEKGPISTRIPFALQEALDRLDDEAKALGLVNRERGIQNELIKAEERLRSSNLNLNESQRSLLLDKIRMITALREEAEVLDKVKGPQEEIVITQTALNSLYTKGSISLMEFNNQMRELMFMQAQINIDNGEGTFADGFILGIEDMLTTVRNFASEAGMVFAEFFEGVTTGFADSIADAIVFGDSLKDAIGNAARSALSSLLSGLIDMGIQFVLNAALAKSLSASQVAGTQAVSAASIAATASTTTAAVAANATVAASAAVPAALQSTISFGGAAVAGLAALAAILAFSKGFKDGGFTGNGGTSDAAGVVHGKEFVVNAKSTARFRPQLEAMNKGQAPQGEGADGTTQGSIQSESGGGGPTGGVRVINVIDPSMVENFMTSSAGEEVFINVIERNADSIGQILGNN